MKTILKSILIFLLIFSSYANSSFEISQEIFKNSQLDLPIHHGDGRFGSYLSVDIPFEPVSNLFLKLKERVLADYGLNLKNRGEAHITVVTPVEYFDELKQFVKIEEIQELANKKQLQNSKFKILCIGEGLKNEMRTYYIVVKSKKLLEFRKELWKLYNVRGGRNLKTSAEKFYPHITLGFSKRDLHESDGVIKSSKSCKFSLQVD